MADWKIAERCNSRKRLSLRFGILGALAILCLAGAPSARAQDAGEYSGATGVSAGAVTSRPEIVGMAAAGHANSSVFLAKPDGPPPEKVNRDWFAKQAGKDGAQLSIDAVPAQSSVWIDGKFVGKAPLTVTLPAGKHHLSLLGPEQEHADRDVDLASGKNQSLEIHLEETYPRAVSITVFGSGHR